MPFIGNIGGTELLVVLVIVLLIFGPSQLPKLGKMFGEGIREFRGATSAKEPANEPPAEPKNDK
jgi:sec-independent protein translocase protein TatA